MKLPAPRRAFVLAAGFATRMRPLSHDTPKALMPLWNRPLLDHSLRRLSEWGVRDVLINTHHGADQVVEYLARYHHDKLRISISFEPEILGTGGALAKADWFCEQGPFWLMNADIIAAVNPRCMAEQMTQRTLSVLWVDSARGPRTVELRNQRVHSFRSDRPGSAGTSTFTGLHLLRPEILEYLPREGFSSIITAYERAMKDGWRVATAAFRNAYWADVGTPSQYLDAHREIAQRYAKKMPGAEYFDTSNASRLRRLRKKGVTLQGVAAVDPSAKVESGARLKNVVLWARAVVHADAKASELIAGREVLARETCTGLIVRSGWALDREERGCLERVLPGVTEGTAQVISRAGSARSYLRIRCGSRRLILLRYTKEREENALYAQHLRFLAKAGVPVPDVLHDDPQKRIMVLEDIGDMSLLRYVEAKERTAVMGMYEKIIHEIARWHGDVTPRFTRSRVPTMPPFSSRLYAWERDLFAKHFLHAQIRCTDACIRDVLREVTGASRRLLKHRPTLIHRDLQSSNVFVLKKRPVFIDVQGMRLGSAMYDLASLLADPYVKLSRKQQGKLLESYRRYHGLSDKEISDYDHAVVQRLAQALGAFGRLRMLDGGVFFGQQTPRAVEQLYVSADRTGDYPALCETLRRHFPDECS